MVGEGDAEDLNRGWGKCGWTRICIREREVEAALEVDYLPYSVEARRYGGPPASPLLP